MKPVGFDLERTRGGMKKAGVDALVISSPENLFYVTGLPATFAAANRVMFVIKDFASVFAVVPVDSEPSLIISAAAYEFAKEHSWFRDLRVVPTTMYSERPPEAEPEIYAKDALGALTALLKERGLDEGVLGVEGLMPTSSYERVKASLPKAKFQDITPLMNHVRLVKSPEEVRRIKTATEITEKAITSCIEMIREGVTELELLKQLKSTFLNDGAGSWGQTTIAAGANGADVFHQPGNYRVKKGDVVRFDVGCMYQLYSSDIARVAVVGEPSERVKRLYATLLEAEQKAIEAVKPAVSLADVFRIGEDAVRKVYPNYSRGHIGHSLGLGLEYFCYIEPDSTLRFESGMVFTLEIPYYIVGFGGFNVEDVVLVTDDGHRLLSTMSRELFVR